MLLAIEFDNLHQILRSLYTEMMPLCGNMAGVAKGIAGLGALFYVAAKVWQSLSNAEPIDVYPLLRPFVIGFCIMFFPTFVLGTINSVMSPVVKGCNNMLETQTFDMNAYREQKDKLEYEAMVRNPEMAYLVSDEAFDKQIDELGWSAKDIATMGGMYMDRAAHDIKQSVRDWFRELLELLFQSAALVIDTIRTFFLIVLAILGPIAFAISVYDGKGDTDPMDNKVHFRLPVAARFRPVQFHSCPNTGAYAPKGYSGAIRPQFRTGRKQQRVHHFYDNRYYRLLHHPHRIELDNSGGRNG